MTYDVPVKSWSSNVLSRIINSGKKKNLNDTKGIEALKDITINIREGEFVSFIGESGCGKSTLLKIIGSIIEPTTGEIRIRGEPPHKARKNREFGFVFQDSVLLSWRTAIANIKLPLEIIGFEKEEQNKIAKKALKLVELEKFENHYVHQLSGGMQQRVSVMRALSYNPSILLMDEMFSGLDSLTKFRLIDCFLDIWENEKKTGIFVTHDINEAIILSDRIAIMTPRPGTIKKVMRIDLPRPRKTSIIKTESFVKYETQLMKNLGVK
jgi:NitT/TauT family transport system ATP-binding protein